MKIYDIVLKDNLQDLIYTVNEALSIGYKPIGGILFVNGKFIQAIYLQNPN